MAGLDIAERRLPQDGRFRLSSGPRRSARLDRADAARRERRACGCSTASTRRSISPAGLRRATCASGSRTAGRCRSGMVLVTGPTGSGKTTTLYAALRLNTRERKILTVEDPVEYHLAGLNQCGASGDRSRSSRRRCARCCGRTPTHAGRRDPRPGDRADRRQAASPAIAALDPAHQHALGTVLRLLDMELEPYLVSAVLKGVVAQRLVRCLCVECRVPYRPEGRLLDRPEFAGGGLLYRPGGCEACGGTGYRGRNAIAELLVFDDELARCVVTGGTPRPWRGGAARRLCRSLQRRARQGGGRDHLARRNLAGRRSRVVPLFHYRALQPSGVEISGELLARTRATPRRDCSRPATTRSRSASAPPRRRVLARRPPPGLGRRAAGGGCRPAS